MSPVNPAFSGKLRHVSLILTHPAGNIKVYAPAGRAGTAVFKTVFFNAAGLYFTLAAPEPLRKKRLQLLQEHMNAIMEYTGAGTGT